MEEADPIRLQGRRITLADAERKARGGWPGRGPCSEMRGGGGIRDIVGRTWGDRCMRR